MSARSQRPLRTHGFKLFGAVIALALVLAIAAAVIEKGGWLWAKDKDDDEENPIVELAAADIARVERAVLNRALPLTGSLSPLLQTTVKAQSPGEVLQVTVREGQAVQQGEVLVRIDTRNLEAQLAARQAELERAEADLALAKLNRENSANLLEKKFISQNAYDTAEAAYQAGLAGVKAAQAQLRLARIALDYATVRAPFAGTIAARLVQPGEKVEIGSNLVALVDLAQLELQAPAPADDVPGVQIGQLASFSVGGFGTRRFSGRVERINPMSDTGSRSVMLYLSVENPDGVLKGGMFAQGELTLHETEPVAAIPLTAVHVEAGVPFVYIIENDHIARRTVTLGLRSEEQNLVEVRDGLSDGERVIAARIDTLKEGAPVILPAGG